MLVLAVDLSVAVPVLVLVVAGQNVLLLIAGIVPDVVPAFVASGAGVTELNALVAVVQVVVTPAVVAVGVRAVLRGVQVFVAGDGHHTAQVVGHVAHLVVVAQLKLHTHVRVAVQVLARCGGAHYGGEAAFVACEQAAAVTMEVVERESEDAVVHVEVNTDVECLGLVPCDVGVGEGKGRSRGDVLAVEHVTG